MMKRKYEVRWYECDLTEEKRRKFFTEIGASMFAAYLEVYENVKPKILEL